MRALPVLILLALVGLAATPSAAAATFDLGASKIVETALDPGEDAVFEMPLVVNQDGFLYAKVLPTPGNAVNDGTKANGSLADGSGWSVSFAMLKADGARIEMGQYVDSTTSTLVPVALGEAVTLVSTVHVPADAARGGPQQRVYVAVAYRLSDSAGSGANSGGVIDEARALTLILSNALLPPAEQVAPEAPTPSGEGTGTDGPTTPTPSTGEETDPGETDPERPGFDDGSGSQGTVDDGSPQENAVPPVSALPSTVLVNVTAIPTWFLAGALVLGAALVLVLAVLAGAIRSLAPERQPKRDRELDRVLDEMEAREVPVSRESSARVEVRSAREE